MKKFLTKIICLLVAVLTLTSALPIAALAADESEDNGNTITDPGYLEVNDGYIRIQVSKDNGGFYIGLVEGDKLTKADDNKNLLYPDSDFDTSFTSFRIEQNGETKDYIFGRDYSYLGIETSEVNVYKSADNAITAEWTVNGLLFKQIIAFMDTNSAMHGMAYVTYSVQNLSGASVEDVEARVMMDTALGFQDYAVYMTANENGSYTSITNEKTVSGADYNNFFYMYDNVTAPSVVAYAINAAVGGQTVVPEKVTFAHWNNLASTVFDYEPSEKDPMDFTSIYYEDYMTADSAMALYYDMGAPADAEDPRAIGFYYGVYSNYTVEDSDVSLNFINASLLEMNEDKSAYLDANGDRGGNLSVDVRLQNVSENSIPSLAIAIMPGEYMYSHDGEGLVEDVTPQEPYYVEVKDLEPGEIRDIRLDFQVDVSSVTDYRRIKLSLYNTSSTTEFTEQNLILTKENYVFCPGSTSAELGFTGMTPQATGESGRRFVYMTGTNFNLLRDKSQYRIVLRPMNGGDDIIIDSSRLVVNPELNTATIVIDETLTIGTWQLIIDYNDAQIKDIVSDSLRLDVLSAEQLDAAAMTAGICTTLSIKRTGDGSDSKPYHYEIVEGASDSDNTLLVFYGNFNALSTPSKGIYRAEAITLAENEVINISNCLDVKNGRVTITVEYDDNGNQTAINVDIDGKVTTTGANTNVWDGVCALTSLEEGELYSLVEYDSQGTRSDAEGDTITLLWPGAASAAQTLVGLLLEMRYCEFGMMTTGTRNTRVVAFSAQLSPSFLIPNGSDYEAMRSPEEEEQVRIVYANYTASDLRRVDNRYEKSRSEWRKDQQGTLNMYVDDILFGGGFIGFNTSVEVGIPAIVNGMPYIEGTLSLKVINDYWEFGVEGKADFFVLEMEASLELKSYKGVPVLDKFYFYIGGALPGIMVDPFGVFWIRGAGGGIDNMYETFFVGDKLPPLTLMLSGEFAIFSVLSARADLSLSLYGIEVALSEIKVAGITIIDYLGGSLYWYPDLSFSFRLDVNIFDVVKGGGGLTVREDFFEAYIYAKIKIPDDVWLVGGAELGSASLGLSTDKIWGSVKVIGIGVGITYYWGGDVDVDLLNASRNDRKIVPVYTDENGNTLYMETANRVRELASTKSKTTPGVSLLSSTASSDIISTDDKRSHTFKLTTTAAEDGLITVTYQAKDKNEAMDLRDTISLSIDDEKYKLYWFDDSKTADDSANLYTNAMLKYDEDTGDATVSISLTDPENQIGKEINVSTGVASNISVYGIERFAELENASYDGTTETVTVTGTGVDQYDSINVYAKNEAGESYQIGSADLSTATQESVTIPIVRPDSLPTGVYTIEAVGCLKNDQGQEVSAPILEAEESLEHTNGDQPNSPTDAQIALGGNYSIDLSVTTNDTDFDGYMIDIYEVTENGNVATSFTNLQIALEEGETVVAGEANTIKVGGRTANTDSDGNPVTDMNGDPVYTGLEAGKTYAISVSTYNTTESGSIIESTAITTKEITMVAPTVTTPELSIEGALPISMGVADMVVDTTNNSDVTVKVGGVNELKSGYYILGDGERVEWNGEDVALGELGDGIYTVTLGGVNATGDSFSTVYQFSVDTDAPSLLITSPQGGGFYDSDSVTVTGMTEAGALITANAGTDTSVSVNADSTGAFSINVPLDITAAYQTVSLTATDAVGNVSELFGFTLTNLVLGANDLELVILMDGEEVEYIAGGGEKKQLSLAFKRGSSYVTINEDSITAARINWRSTVIQGKADISSSGLLTTENNTTGLIVATLDNYSASVEIMPTSLQTVDAALNIPEDAYVYDGSAKEPEVILNRSEELVVGVDYSVSYLDNVNAGTATVIVTALDSGKCSGSKVITFEISAAPITNAQITAEGELNDPLVTVTLGELTLIQDTDYTLSIDVDEDAELALITVEGIGNYTGNKTLLHDYGETSTDGYKPDDETEDETGNGDTTETEDNSGGGSDGSSNQGGVDPAVWIVSVCVVGAGGIGVGIYFLFIKKKYLNVIAAIKKLFRK